MRLQIASRRDDIYRMNPVARAPIGYAGLSLHALGVAMGYDAETARQSAFQFMKSGDPRISMLRRFAKAMEMPLEDLLAETNKSRSKQPNATGGFFP